MLKACEKKIALFYCSRRTLLVNELFLRPFICVTYLVQQLFLKIIWELKTVIPIRGVMDKEYNYHHSIPCWAYRTRWLRETSQIKPLQRDGNIVTKPLTNPSGQRGVSMPNPPVWREESKAVIRFCKYDSRIKSHLLVAA